MSEELVDPASAAEAKAIQFVQIAVMAAEGIAVLATARAEASAARTEADAGRLLTSIAATRASAESLWQPAIDSARLGQLNDRQALTAWSAAQPWRDAEPAAEAASCGSLDRLRELQPRAVHAYDAQRAQGEGPAQAMRSVVPLLAGATNPSTVSTMHGSVIHSAADAVAASYPAPLTAAAASAATQAGVSGTRNQSIVAAARPNATRFGR